MFHTFCQSSTTDLFTKRLRQRETEAEKVRQTDRQTDRQRQRHKETKRDRDTEREKVKRRRKVTPFPNTDLSATPNTQLQPEK